MLHYRSPKETGMDVIVYERDLLRHCANTVDAKHAKSQASSSDESKAEYFLGIEGFLLHFRNLLGFFMNKEHKSKKYKDSDLIIARSEQWSNGQTVVDKHFCERLTQRAMQVNKKFGFSADVDCYQKISWFLQHCTDHRYLEHRNWDLAAMFTEFGPIVDDFITEFAPERAAGVHLPGSK